MADLKSLTVKYLRAFARKHLGRGQGTLRAEVLTALVERVPGLMRWLGLQESRGSPDGEVQKPGSREQVAPMRAASPDSPEEPSKPPPPPARPLPGDDDEKTPVYLPPSPAKVINFPPKPKPGQPLPREPLKDDEPTLVRAPESPPPTAAEPLVEGFFVARVAGEAANVQPQDTLVPADPNEPDDELPTAYGDDTLLLLPRDPHTLFVLWDFSAATLGRALDGLEAPRAVLRVYEDGDLLVRVVDVALESRGYYVHGLPAGRLYRVEVHFVGHTERSRRIGLSSNRVSLPLAGPSSDTSVRFLRMPRATPRRTSGGAPIAATAHSRTAPVEEREYITWRRVALPGSVGGEPRAGGRRHTPGGPDAPGEQAPTPGYLSVPRAEGSSEQRGGQWVWAYGLADDSAQWMRSHGPAGSSEQGR